MTEEWVVLVEAELDEGGVIELPALERLLGLLCDHSPSALWCVDRYAVQVVVSAASPEAALVSGLSMWRQAVDRLDLPAWRLVRAEIKTPAELEAEHRTTREADVGPTHTPTSGDALRAASLATRTLLAGRSRREASEIVTALTRQLGAEVVGGAERHPFALPFDLSFGEGEPCYPAADPVSVARLHLEEVLPSVLLDAARVVRLLEPVLLVES